MSREGRGKLIVFEGGEGSGKTTQIKRLHDWLTHGDGQELLAPKNTKTRVHLTREPGGSPLGKNIRHLLLTGNLLTGNLLTEDASIRDSSKRGSSTEGSPEAAPIASKTELLLYAADRAQHVEEQLCPWLEAGDWVLCDRYTDSTLAYQGYGRQLDLDLIHQLNQIATGGLKSDLTLWLDVPPSVGLARMHQRGQADRIEQAGAAFHQRVYDGFAALAKETPKETAKETPKDPTKKGINPYSSGPTKTIDGNRPVEVITTHIQQIITDTFFNRP